MSAFDPDLMFHLQRSRCIDAFARAEAAIAALLRRHIMLKGTELLGCNLAKLREVPAGPQYSKAAHSIVQAALEELEPLVLVRNDLVHAELVVLKGNGRAYATFINSRLKGDAGVHARLMTSGSFDQFENTITAISVKLEQAARSPAT